jgi:serine/threonine protein kinase
MEYVEGLPLADLIPEGGMSPEQVLRYAAQIAGALAFAHEHGTIHGDLKGTNIIITSEGNSKLLDFGLGRRIPRSGMAEVTTSCLALAETGATAGTLPYLAPEVLRGSPTSLPSDIWALGVLLYQMATGELPFRGATPFELSVEIMVGTPPKMGQLPEPLQSTLRRCLEKDPPGPHPPGTRTPERARGEFTGSRARCCALARARSRNFLYHRRDPGGARRLPPPPQVVGGRGGSGALRAAAGGHLRPARLGGTA